MRKILFLIVLFPIFIYGQRQRDFLNLFKNTDSIQIKFDDSAEIEDSCMIEKYLCTVRNECFCDPIRNKNLYYYAISKTDFKDYWIILYGVTDRYENVLFLITFNKNKGNVVSRLRIPVPVENDSIESKIVDNKIEIYRKIRKECAEYIEGQENYCFFTVKETYNLDENFTPVQRDPWISWNKVRMLFPKIKKGSG